MALRNATGWIVAGLVTGMCCSARAEREVIWIEAEKPTVTNFPKRYVSPRKPIDDLSGGHWLVANERQERPLLFAEYELISEKGGRYDLWVRKFWFHGPFRWRFDDQPWRRCERKVCLFDQLPVKNTSASWIPLGAVELTAGSHVLRIETLEFDTPEDLEKRRAKLPFKPDLTSTELASWCTATYPVEVAAGQSFDVTISYKDINEKTKLSVVLNWSKGNGQYGSYLSGSKPVQIQGAGQHTFSLKVRAKRGMKSVSIVVYVSPDGKWKSKTRRANTSLLPVDSESVQATLANRKSLFFVDCFVLAEPPFIPYGNKKPGEKYDRAEVGWFAFEPEQDVFGEAILDLRSLNHSEAGAQGYLRADGSHFCFDKDRQPVKFWGVVIGSDVIYLEDTTMDYYARLLAKRGVNMIRLHGSFHDQRSDDPSLISARFVDRFNYFVSAMKRQGIYIMLNTYYNKFVRAKGASEWFPGYREGVSAPHFQFIHPNGEKLWRSWVTQLLDTHNPYTGMRNADDPALAIIQIVNEDNYFFWTFQPYKTIPGEVMHVLEKRFGDWLAEKYGSLKKAKRKWGRFKSVQGDDFGRGRVGLYEIWNLHGSAKRDRARLASSPQRFYDQAQFLTEDLRSWFGRAQEWLKSELGFKGLVNGGNWKSADPRVLEPLDKYANSICDVMDRHGVVLPSVCDLARTYSIQKGDAYVNTAAVTDPMGTPLMEIQYGDKVHIVSEPKKTMPNAWRADWIPLMSIYGALQGTDATMNFAATPNWQLMHKRWSLLTPVTFGQYPAASLIYRNGYVREGPMVVHEALQLEDLYALKGAALTEAAGLDEMTEADIPAGGRAIVDEIDRIDPLAFYVGRVARTIGEDPGRSEMTNLSGYIDRKRQIVRSATGELIWDWGNGLVQINARCAQGVVGFLSRAGSVPLSDVTIECENEYGAVLVVSMDGKPIASSEKILVEVMSEDKNYGWRTKPTKRVLKKKSKKKKKGDTNDAPGVDMLEITSVGGPPIVVRELAGTVSIRHEDAGALETVALDHNGYERMTLPSPGDDDVKISLLSDCIYYVVMKKRPELN